MSTVRPLPGRRRTYDHRVLVGASRRGPGAGRSSNTLAVRGVSHAGAFSPGWFELRARYEQNVPNKRRPGTRWEKPAPALGLRCPRPQRAWGRGQGGWNIPTSLSVTVVLLAVVTLM